MRTAIGRSVLICVTSLLIFGPGCDEQGDASGQAGSKAAGERGAEGPSEGAETVDEPAEGEESGEIEESTEGEEATKDQTPSDKPVLNELPEHLAEPSLSSISRGRVFVEVRAPKHIRDMNARTTPYEPDEWPEPYRHLRSLDALTSEGRVRLDLTDVVRQWRAEGTVAYYSLRTEPSEVLVSEELSSTIVAPPGVLPPKARIRAPEAKHLDESRAADLWERFVEASSEKARERLEKKDPQTISESFNAYHADFPGEYDAWVTIAVGRDPCLSAAYLIDRSGTNVTVVEPAMMGYHCVEPLALADMNGNDRWGVIYKEGVDTHPFDIKWMELGADDKPVTRGLKTID